MRTCVVCGIDISHRRWNAKTCSDECAKKRQQQSVLKYRRRHHEQYLQQVRDYRAKKRQKRQCEVCGADITGLHALAKTCSDECRKELQRVNHRARRRDNPEKHREWERRARERHGAKRKERQAAYLEQNRERINEQKRAHYAANRERLLAEQSLRYANDPSKRERNRRRNAEAIAAVKLVREIREKGIEALL